MKSVIFGANGPTGRLATSCALAAGHTVVAVTRQPREFPIQGHAHGVTDDPPGSLLRQRI
jgi:putative NADH-flavin reductase